MKIAVTGASGFVGSNVTHLLKAEGHEIVPVSRRDGVDIQSEAELEKVFSGCDGVAHCAGINREIGTQTYRNIHIDGTRRVVAAAQKCGVRKITLMSFLRARPDCGSGYHESKFAAEEIIAKSGLDYTIIKAGVIYGQGDHMLNHLSHAFYTFPIFGLVGFKDQKVRPTAVEDVARIIIASFSDPRLSRKRVPVTGPEELTLAQAVKRVSQVVGRAPLFFPMPVWMHLVFAWGLEQVMKVPLIATAQVRILAEGLVVPAGNWDPLPEDLAPKTAFSSYSICKGLPSPGPFTLKDLRLPI
ncbi:MAG: NAD(P)H-binding protein [Nitrospinota bacterium]|nr:NAD(P)H-binding protein [Nitrospinota bacterium]